MRGGPRHRPYRQWLLLGLIIVRFSGAFLHSGGRARSSRVAGGAFPTASRPLPYRCPLSPWADAANRYSMNALTMGESCFPAG